MKPNPNDTRTPENIIRYVLYVPAVFPPRRSISQNNTLSAKIPTIVVAVSSRPIAWALRTDCLQGDANCLSAPM